MCLGTPMKVLSISDHFARCERSGIQREVALHLLDPDNIQPGDYLIVHLGFAIERIRQEDAKEAEDIWQEWDSFTEGSEPSAG